LYTESSSITKFSVPYSVASDKLKANS